MPLHPLHTQHLLLEKPYAQPQRRDGRLLRGAARCKPRTSADAPALGSGSGSAGSPGARAAVVGYARASSITSNGPAVCATSGAARSGAGEASGAAVARALGRRRNHGLGWRLDSTKIFEIGVHTHSMNRESLRSPRPSRETFTPSSATQT
jgi:hypothetical protein